MVDQVVDSASLTRALVSLAPLSVFWSWWVDYESEGDAAVYALFIGQGGISLPDRDYYLQNSTEMRAYRRRFVDVGQKLLELSGMEAAGAAKAMSDNLEIESALAAAMTPRDTERDEHGKHSNSQQLAHLCPCIAWEAWGRGLGLLPDQLTANLVLENSHAVEQVCRIITSAGLVKVGN